SAEPLLGEVRLDVLDHLPRTRVAQMLRGTHSKAEAAELAERHEALWPALATRFGADGHLDVRSAINWVIAGGESGPRHRPLNPEWARRLRDDCLGAGNAFFFKQVGGRTS